MAHRSSEEVSHRWEPTDPGEPPVERIAMVDRRIDIALAAALAALGVALIVLSGDIRAGSIPDPIGAGGMPRALGAFMVVAGVVLIARRLVSWRRNPGHLVPADGGTGDEPDYPSSAVRAFGMLAAAWGWAMLIPLVGYLTSSFLLAVVGIASMKVRSPWKLIVVPALFAAITWLLFNRLFGIPFPAGPIEQLGEEYIPSLE